MSSSDEQTNEPTVQTLIAAAGLTQRQLGHELDVTELSINNWANGRKLPRVDRFFAACKKLNVSPKTLARSMQIDVSGVPDDVPLERSHISDTEEED